MGANRNFGWSRDKWDLGCDFSEIIEVVKGLKFDY